MPISLKRASGTVAGVRLSGNQGNYGISSTNANYGSPISVAGVDISSSLTQVVSVNVPSGQKIVLLNSSLNNIGVSGELYVEIEIDGVTVLTSSNPSYTSSSATILGSGLSGVYSTAILDLVVENNFKIRVRRTGANSANLNVTYLVVV